MNNGLKSNRRIIFEELCYLITTGVPISQDVLATRANCDPRTVRRAIADLEAWGMVKVLRGRPGNRAEYQICWQN